MALLWLPEQPSAVAAEQGERSRAPGLGEAGRLQPRPRAGPRARSARPTPPRRAARPEGQGCLTAGWQVAPGRAGLQSRAQEVSLSLRQLSPACCGRRLPRRCQSPARSRRAVGCMSSRRLYSPPPPAPRPRRPPRPQLSRSRHANFWLGTKGSARAGRGRALLSRTERPARPPLAAKCWAGGRLCSPFPAPPRRASPPGQPPWEPGSATRRAEGRRTEAEPRRGQGRGATRAAREGAAERIGGRGGGGGASARFGAREPGASRSAPRVHAHRAPGHRGEPRPREGERRGAVPARGPAAPRKSPDKGKPRPPPPARPPAAPAASRPAGLRAQPKGGRTQRGAPRLPHGRPGPLCRRGRGGCGGPRAWCSAPAPPPKAAPVPPMSPLARPRRAQEHASLKRGTFPGSEGVLLTNGQRSRY